MHMTSAHVWCVMLWQVRRLAFVLHAWAKYLARYQAMQERAVLMSHFDGWLDVVQRKVGLP